GASMFKRSSVTVIMVLFALSVIFTGNVFAEEHEIKGYLSLGGVSFDMDNLNTSLDNKGFSKFSDDLFSIGGGAFHKVAPRFLIGAEGHFLIGKQISSDIGTKTYTSSILGGYGLLNMGYLAHTSDHLDVMPILGLGLGGLNLKIGESSFDAILDNPTRAASLYTMSFLFNFALQTEYKVKILDDNGKDAFFCVGLQAGYLLSPFDSGWYMDEIALTDDPDGGLSGPYLRLTIGGEGTIDK
ncbi:hypothetical protein ACFL6K_00995, partial [Candidatus Latescibacterota bacterium]